MQTGAVLKWKPVREEHLRLVYGKLFVWNVSEGSLTGVVVFPELTSGDDYLEASESKISTGVSNVSLTRPAVGLVLSRLVAVHFGAWPRDIYVMFREICSLTTSKFPPFKGF